MKKHLTIPLLLGSLTLAMGAAAGVLLSRHDNGVKEAEASTSLGFDSVGSDCYYYHRTGSDLSALNAASMTHCTDDNYYKTTLLQNSNNSSYYREDTTLLLTTPDTMTFDVIFVPVRLYIPSVGGYSFARFQNISLSFEMQKIATGGGAYACAEVFLLEGKSMPTSFNTAGNNTASNDDSIMRLSTDSKNSWVSTTKTILSVYEEKQNNASGPNHIWIDLGLMICGRYGSSYSNAVQIRLTTTSNSCSTEEAALHCNGKLFRQTSFHSALAEFNGANNRTLKFIQDVSVSSNNDNYRILTASGTVDLNGHTFTSTNINAFALTSSNSVTITGGSIVSQGNTNSALRVGPNATLILSSGMSISGTNKGISNEGTLNCTGVTISSTSASLDNEGTASLINSTLTVTGESSSTVLNSGNLLVRGSTLNAGSKGKSIMITSASAETTIIGNSSLPKGYYVGTGYKASKLYLYTGTTTYTGSAISVTSADAYAYSDVVAYLYQSSHSSKVNITNTLSSYLTLSYSSANHTYYVDYKQFNLTVNMTHGTYTVSKSSSIVYADHITLNYNLDEGYELKNSGISAAYCSYSADYENSTIDFYNFTNTPTITITPNIIDCTLNYNGNGHTSTLSGEGKAPTTTIHNNYGDEITVLASPYGKSGYNFAGWNTEPDGSGTPYNIGDKFIIKANTILYAQWVEEAYAILDQFVTDYMHMSDYTGGGTGLCKGPSGYYVTAKHALMALTSAQINTFRSDFMYTAAKNRYEQWAYFNNDLDYAYEDDYSHISSSRTIDVNPNNVNVWIIVAIASVATLSFAGLLLLKKRKHQ